MKASAIARYSVLSGGIAVATAVSLLALAASSVALDARWMMSGWGIMALVGVAGGAWLTATHGRPGSGFIVALGTCMLSRLFASAIGAAAAVMTGGHAVTSYLTGLGAGFVTLQVFEVGWFLRRDRTTATTRGRGGAC